MSAKKKIAILGGGVGAMTTAFALTDFDGWQDRYEIDVYQMGWRLGGKGASGRNAEIASRIEEHGLHIWFGYYQNAFRMMRRVFDECARLKLTPDSPFQTWTDAFQPQSAATVWEERNGKWQARSMKFPGKPGFPGDDELFHPGAAPPQPWEFLTLIIDWLIDQCQRLSLKAAGNPKLPDFIAKGLDDLGIHLHRAEDLASEPFPLLRLAHRLSVRLASLSAARPPNAIAWIASLVSDSIDAVTGAIEAQLDRSDAARRTIEILDLSAATVRGLIADDVLNRGFASIDDYDLREWLRKHGARHWDSPQLSGIYDSSFGYRHGDQNQPNMAAGSTLYQSLRMFMTYRGAVCWRMKAGMGDTIFVPLYLLLRARGVRFHFFHRIKELTLSADSSQVDRIHIDVQATVKPEAAEYQPLCVVKNLPCWPNQPLYGQLVEGEELKNYNLESAYTEWHDRLPPLTLTRGVDFDDVVLGLSVGPLRYVCKELMHANSKWRDMVEKVETVQTHAVQWWFHKTNQELGWQHGAVLPEDERALSGSYQPPFDSYSDFTHVLPTEDWTAQDNVQSLAYMCHALSEDAPPPEPFTDPAFPEQQTERVREYARNYLRNQVQPLWPNAMVPGTDQFDWNLLVDRAGGAGERRADAQYARANVDPSERYVLSIAGSTKYRLPSDQSGFANLYLAGDYTLNDFSAGLVEGAAISGLIAAKALCGKPDCIYYTSLDRGPDAAVPAPETSAERPFGTLLHRAEGLLSGLKQRLVTPPERPWIVFMTWRDLVFASWRVPVEVIRPKVPLELDIDTFDGSAWVTIVPMRVTDCHFRGVAPIKGMDVFRELNLRVYVTRNGKAGVYFLSIECPATVTDWMAFNFFGVPYLEANIVTHQDNDTYHFATERTKKNWPPAAFFGRFQPTGEAVSPASGSLDAFLVERYSLYFVKNGTVHRGDIHHQDWHVQPVDLQIDVNTIAQAAGLDLPPKPDHVAFALRTDTLIWPPVRDELAGAAGE